MVSKEVLIERKYSGNVPTSIIWTYHGQTVIEHVVGLDREHAADYSQLINHKWFNRLRYIKQLSLINRVFSGANHDRGEHCIGVFYHAQKIMDNTSVRLDAYGKHLLCLDGLVHDIAHTAYSHVGESVATDCGLEDHKEMGLRRIGDMGDIIEAITKEAGFGEDTVSHVVPDLKRQMAEKGPIAKLISNKDRLDKWDYVARDWHYCQAGMLPQISVLIEALYFDGERSAIKARAQGALGSFIQAYTDNTINIYKRKDVEAIEAFFARAIMEAREAGLDFEKLYEFEDRQLDDELCRYPVSRRLFEATRSRDVRGRWASVISLRPKGYEWAARKNGDSDLLVEEMADEEMAKINGDVKLPKLFAIERRIKGEAGLAPEDFVITYTPQVNRLEIKESNLLFIENDKPVFRNIFDLEEGFAELMRSRLKQCYSIEFVASRNKAQAVAEKIKQMGGPKKILMEALEK